MTLTSHQYRNKTHKPATHRERGAINHRAACGAVKSVLFQLLLRSPAATNTKRQRPRTGSNTIQTDKQAELVGVVSRSHKRRSADNPTISNCDSLQKTK